MYTFTPRNENGTFKSYEQVNQEHYAEGKASGEATAALAALLAYLLVESAKYISKEFKEQPIRTIPPRALGGRNFGAPKVW
jgi:hypothetical protein